MVPAGGGLFRLTGLTWQYWAIRWVAMKDKDFAMLVTGMAVGAIVGATWITVLDRKITALSDTILVQSETVRDLCEIAKMNYEFAQATNERLKALEDARAVATPRTPMPYMPSIGPHVQLDFPRSTPVIAPNQGTLITSNQWGEVWAVPADVVYPVGRGQK